jgi:hypothetical protein
LHFRDTDDPCHCGLKCPAFLSMTDEYARSASVRNSNTASASGERETSPSSRSSWRRTA